MLGFKIDFLVEGDFPPLLLLQILVVVVFFGS